MTWRKRPDYERRQPIGGGMSIARTMAHLAIGQQPAWHRCPRNECMRQRMCMAPRDCQAPKGGES